MWKPVDQRRPWDLNKDNNCSFLSRKV
jgi:hypothetical protein